MLKISDILKKAKKNKTRKKKKAQAVELPAPDVTMEKPQEQEVQPEIKPLDVELKIEKPGQQEIHDVKPEQVREIIPDEQPQTIVESAQVSEVYQRGISFVQAIMSPFDDTQKKTFTEAEDIIKDFVGFLSSDENQLLRLFFAEYSTEKGYIYQHSVNVCILCLRLAIALNYDYAHLKQLGLAALVHDIGLIKYDNLISSPLRFNDNDYTEVKKHPIVGKDILKKIAEELKFEIFDVIHQEHERVDGSGYPYGLRDKEICEYARLIGVVDVYEAMNHARPYRKKLGYLQIMKEILHDKAKFDLKFLKILIDTVGVFPITASVRLNTKEIATVIKQNQQMPLRPVINVIQDAQGQKLPQIKQIDLSKNFSVYIHDVHSETKLK